MTQDQTKTTGTPDQDGGDALEQSGKTGTPDAEGRDAESGKQGQEPDYKELYLQAKEKVEKVNELERRLKELEEEPPPPVADSPKDSNKLTFEKFLESNDPVAERVVRLERALFLKEQLDGISDPVEREEARKHFLKQQDRLGDIKAAHAELRAPKLEKEVQALREKLAQLEKGPDPEVIKAPPTGGREVTARETRQKQQWTEEQFDAEAERVRKTKGELAALKFLEGAPSEWRK